MREVVRVVQAICDLVPTGGMGPNDRILFTTYMEWRVQAAGRLTTIMGALDAGDEYRALQFSEMEPRLPDFVAHLGLVPQMGLAEEKRWTEYCRRHDLPLPPPLEPTSVQRLHQLYMRGITPGSPFYQECLAAMTAGDEERALGLIRSIVRLTRDTEARAQMERMLRKKAVPQLAALRACLEQGHEDGVLGWLDEFERSGAESVLGQDPVHAAALTARRTIMSRRATAEAGTFLDAAAEQAKQENWPNVAAGVVRIRRLERDWGLAFTPAQAALLGSLEKRLAEIQSEAERRSQFSQALANLMLHAERTHRQMRGDERAPPNEVRNALESVANLWGSVESLHFPIPERELARLHEITGVLEARLNGRGQTSQTRYRRLMLLLALLLALVAGGIHLYQSAQAKLRELEAMRDGRMAEAANRLLMAIMQSSASWILGLSPETKAKLEALRKWVQQEAEHAREAESDLADIAALLDGPLEELSPEELMQKLLEADEEIKKLSPEYLRMLQGKLQGLKGRAEEHFRSLLAQNLEKVRGALKELEKLAALLDFEKPVLELAATLSTMQAELKEIGPLEHPSVPPLRFPPDITAALRGFRGKAEMFATEMSAFAEAKGAMTGAAKLEQYKLALEACARLRFGESREAAALLAAFPTEDETVARLLFRGDLKAWEAAKEQAAGTYDFIPGDLRPEDLRPLAQLRDDPALNAPGPARKVLDALRLGEAFNAASGKLTTPLIELADRVLRFPQGDVVAKAFLLQELGGILRARSLDWGLHYTPELAARQTELDTILGNTRLHLGDWNRPATRKKWQPELQRFFEAAAQDKPFHETAVACKERVAPVVAQGVAYAGFVDEAHSGRLKTRADAARVVWGLPEQDQPPVPVECGPGAMEKKNLKTLRKWSPLLTIPVEPDPAEARTAEQ